MSDVAAPDLCKKLHDISGWEDGLNTELYVFDQKGKFVAQVNKESFSIDRFGSFVPAYDLGYLLRRLAENAKMHNIKLHYSIVQKLWYCGYRSEGSACWGDIPEDAAIKLVIRLFKAGVLKKQ